MENKTKYRQQFKAILYVLIVLGFVSIGQILVLLVLLK